MYTMMALLTLTAGAAAPAYDHHGGCAGWSNGCAGYSSCAGRSGFCGSGFCGKLFSGHSSCAGYSSCAGCSGWSNGCGGQVVSYSSGCSGWSNGCAGYSSCAGRSGFCGSGFCGKLFGGHRSSCAGYACGGCGGWNSGCTGVVYSAPANCGCCGSTVIYGQVHTGAVIQGTTTTGTATTGTATTGTATTGAATGSDTKKEEMPKALSADEQKMLDEIKGKMEGKETADKIKEYEAWYKKTATAEERAKDFKEFTGKDKP